MQLAVLMVVGWVLLLMPRGGSVALALLADRGGNGCAPVLYSRRRQMGVRTQLHGLYTAVVIMVVLLALAPLFSPLPMAVLAATIFMALKGMHKITRLVEPTR